jgi:tetratricopeptide (TPR) repeat protein
MSASLRLLITDYQNIGRFRWRLEDANGRTLADHNVNLNTAAPAYAGYVDLPTYLRHYTAIRTNSEMLVEIGDWIGEHVFGPILTAILKNLMPPVTTVAVVAPLHAQDLLARPLELASTNGKTLTQNKIRLIYEREGASAPKPKTAGNPLRILAVFSLPEAGAPLNLRQERYTLEQFVRSLQASGKAVELRVLQYGATRETLEQALNDGDGWDILHFSGHGLNGVLVLEKPDGTSDTITTDELEALLDDVKGRVQLLFLSACLSGATSLSSARRALGLAAMPMRDDQGMPGEETETVQATALPSLGQTLAERLDCAAIAMRYNVGDRFARNLSDGLYSALLNDHQPLPRALHTALSRALTSDVEATLPLSAITPVLFGRRATDLRLFFPERPINAALPPSGMAHFLPEPERFVGRLKPMIAGREVIAERGSLRGILYHGMAGAGKTTLATELAYRYREGRFRGFVWHAAAPEGGEIVGEFARFLDALHYQLELTDTALLENADRPAEFNRRTLPRLREYLRSNATLIVIDNLEGLLTPDGNWRAPEWGPLMEALLDRQSQSRIILTSRRVPNSLAALPQLRQLAVHALSLPEAILLARELPNLSTLFADDAGRQLLQWTLHLVQGHPKLLEFADKLAADRTALQAQLQNAEFAAEGNASLQAFFVTGESTREEPQFLYAFTCWTHDLTAQCTSSARLLFQFLACLEEADRDFPTLELTWPVFLTEIPDDLMGSAEARAGAAQFLSEGLRELARCGLIEVQVLPLTEDSPTHASQPVHYVLHPVVAEAGRRDAKPVSRSTVDLTLAGLYYALFQSFLAEEAEGYSSMIVTAAKRALPYLVRQQTWETVAYLIQHIAGRDESSRTLALMLPWLERAAQVQAELGEHGLAAGVLARMLVAAGRKDEAEPRFRELIAQAIEHGDYGTASALAGDLTNLLRDMGRYEEAMMSVKQEIAYDKQAGAGPWTQLSTEIKRLQICNNWGQWHETLVEGETLRKRMDELSKNIGLRQDESVLPYNVREGLLDTLRDAFLYTCQYDQALACNGTIFQSLKTRNADALTISRNRFEDYSPLLNLGRYAEVRVLLQQCQDQFVEAGDNRGLCDVYGAFATLEKQMNNLTDAIRFAKLSLLHSYRAISPDSCASNHNNLANYYTRLGRVTEGQAHRLASCIISLQINVGRQGKRLWILAQNDLSGAPPSFDWVADMVEQVPGVRFRELFARLPHRVPDGDAAITAVWEMARQQQVTQQVVVATLPPDLCAAVEARNEATFNAVMAQLPLEEAKVVARRLTEAGIMHRIF